ncbi:unnamed protein product [Arctia plantaginis]|uniref:Peptidase S1 domain-containing protein n=1 Tax=Arctia plantaginis TaxID=874455 RepID=A0A8S0YTV9_ARCPL|nr:unnamed protein product [Arctia plantaginis]
MASLLLAIDFNSFADPDIQMYQKIRFKLITAWFNLFTFIYFPICFYCDWRNLREEHEMKHVKVLNQLRYLCFTSFLLPATADAHRPGGVTICARWLAGAGCEKPKIDFGDILFWRVWNSHRELIAPLSVYAVVPFWTQHSMHTVSLIIVLIDLVLVKRERPKNSILNIGILSCFLLTYILVCVQSFLKGEYIYPGAPCAWQERKGTCVSIYKCLSAIIDAKNKDPPPMCSYEEGQIPSVCCTDCNLIKDIRNLVFDKRLGIHPKPKEKSQYYCLKMLHELDFPCKRRTNVSYYKVTTQQDYYNCSTLRRLTKNRKNFYTRYTWKEELTHLAMLGYGTTESGLQWLCGGSLISEHFVLTAAHCTHNPYFGIVSHIGLGERTGSFEHWHQYRVSNIFIYPKFKAPFMYHDIALLRSEIKILFHFWVVPGCLPHDSDLKNSTAMATAIGNYTTPRSNLLGSYYVQLERFSTNDCKLLYPPSRELPHGFNETTQICYGYKNRLNMPCGTDGGAPLQRAHAKYPCGFSIIGITSFERSCRYKVGFGLYTNVSYYNSWIESVVWP